MPRTEVPVTMGRRVRSWAAVRDVESATADRAEDPPDDRESDMVKRISTKEEINFGIFDSVW